VCSGGVAVVTPFAARCVSTADHGTSRPPKSQIGLRSPPGFRFTVSSRLRPIRFCGGGPVEVVVQVEVSLRARRPHGGRAIPQQVQVEDVVRPPSACRRWGAPLIRPDDVELVRDGGRNIANRATCRSYGAPRRAAEETRCSQFRPPGRLMGLGRCRADAAGRWGGPPWPSRSAEERG